MTAITIIDPAPSLLLTEPSPSGDQPLGLVPGYDNSLGEARWMRPRVTMGHSALDSSSGSIPLTGNAWNLIGSAPITGGFRYGMASYIPSGWWYLWGQIGIAGQQPGVRYDVKITQGTTLDPTYTGMLTGNPVIIGGGVGTSPPVAWGEFSIPIMAPQIQVACSAGQAAEILVWVFPQVSGSAGGTLNVVQPSVSGGGVPIGMVSQLTVLRSQGVASTNT